MAANLKGAARSAVAVEAYHLSTQRMYYTAIAEHLGIGRNLVATLVKEEQARRKEEKPDDADRARDEAIATYAWVIARACEELDSDELKANSLNRSGYLNSIISAQSKIDEITGVRAPTRSEQDVNVSYRDYTTGDELAEMFAELDALIEGQETQAVREDGELDSEEPLDTESPY